MNSHLSSEQVDGVLNGQPSPDAAAHLSGCVQCAGELASLRSAFGNLRQATSAAADHHRRSASAAKSRKMPRIAWALATAAVVVSIAAPVVLHRRADVPVAVDGGRVVTPEPISDEALLNSVQNDLSSVPESLLPLAGTSTNSTNPTERRKN